MNHKFIRGIGAVLATVVLVTGCSKGPRIVPIESLSPVQTAANVIPSRYSIKKNARYTNAEPVSRCNTINNIGSKTIPTTGNEHFKRSIEKPCTFIYLATAKAVENFANSAG